ncbi:menaquinol-cytochrome c reductase cytochrome b subunit [bacterium BMS3Abin07]|nr:menaquinol-cytochrome c reductase cytochrome b subunit [bacterium BMS3Abin07]GBE33231.1 menaquinol-cytochrome c reductase cytochrome b subunit [bacterium BMS3Bbin05]
MGEIFDWIDNRFGIRQPHRKFLHRDIPEGVNYSFCLGGAALVCFIMLFLSGIMLSIYYVPSETEAFNSIVRINNEVRLGWFIRSFHKWSSNLLIISIILHTIRVFIYKAYRSPRELNWVAGSLTLVIVFASGFTGYLLPWDQKAYWATEVGTSMAKTIPIIGKYLLYLVRGGEDVTGTTLIRFYAMHIIYLPSCLFILLWAHFHMVRKQGIKGGL